MVAEDLGWLRILGRGPHPLEQIFLCKFSCHLPSRDFFSLSAAKQTSLLESQQAASAPAILQFYVCSTLLGSGRALDFLCHAGAKGFLARWLPSELVALASD